jgi:hypothetical protein
LAGEDAEERGGDGVDFPRHVLRQVGADGVEPSHARGPGDRGQQIRAADDPEHVEAAQRVDRC